MASREPIQIKLGDKDLKIRPLTIGQVERLETLVSGSTTGGPSGAALGRAVLDVALARDHEVVAADLEANLGEIATAMGAILRLGGFLPALSGEVPAAAGSASTGGESEAA